MPVTHGQPERVRDPDADLVVAGVGGLVAEQQQVVAARRRRGGDLGGDRRGGGDRAPFPAVGLQQHRLLGAERQHVAELLGRLGRAEGEHRHVAAVPLDDLHGLLDRALLVRADREPGHPGVHLLPVGGEHDLAADHGDALDADHDVHRRSAPDPSFSGSNSGVEPATATVTG